MLGLTEVPPALSGLVEPVGLVPDEVLLLCGRPDGTPSSWWTPWLASADERDVPARRAAARDLLIDHGVLVDEHTLTGLLGEVAAIVEGADLALLIEQDEPAVADPVRCSVLVTDDRALFDEQRGDVRLHDLCIAAPAGAVALLVGVLDPRDAGSSATPPEVVAVDELVTRWPPDRRIATTRIVRADRSASTSMLVTVIEDAEDGLVCAIARDDRRVAVARLSPAAVVELARSLLGAADGAA